MAEAAAQQAAAVAHARALAALAREMLADVGGGDVFSYVRLLFTELAAALHVEPGRQAQEDANDAACQGWRSRAQRRRAQRKRAMRALIGARRGVDTHAGGEGGEHDKAKSSPLVFWEAAAKPSALGKRHVTADAVFDAKDRDAGRDAGASASVSPGAAESAGALPQRQQMLPLQQQQQQAQQAAAPAAADPASTQTELAENDEQPTSVEPRVAAAAAPHKRQAVAAGTAVGVAVGVGGKTPGASDVAGAAPAAYDDEYQLVISRRRGAGAQRPKAAKEGRVPAGRLRVRKGGKAAAGNRYGVVRERGGGGFWDCAQCGEPAWGGRLCGAGGIACANAEV